MFSSRDSKFSPSSVWDTQKPTTSYRLVGYSETGKANFGTGRFFSLVQTQTRKVGFKPKLGEHLLHLYSK